jgi:hypothetical protein
VFSVSTFRDTFACLLCVVPVSVHYRLCLVAVCMKVLQNGRLVRFSTLTVSRCLFSCTVSNQTATSLAVSRAAVPKVVTTYTDHGKRSNCGRKSQNAAVKVTAELSIHPEDPVSTKIVRHDLYKSNTHCRAGIAKPVITDSKAKR